MNLAELRLEYNSLLKSYDEVKATNFVENLVESNNNDMINFHYSLLKNHDSEYLFYEIRGDFYLHGKEGKLFLLKKLKTEKDIDLKAEALFILGALDDLELSERDLIKKTAISFINNKGSYKLQYYGIIVIGWIGKKEDLSILDKQMRENINPKLRAHAVTALRQIWFSYTRLKNSILRLYYNALLKEDDNTVNAPIIACIQDLLQRKFGVKENMKGEYSGDIDLAKPKALKAVELFLNI